MPIARVQLPDGRIGRFEVEEGTTPQQVEEFALQKFGSKSEDEAADSKPDISKTESYARGALQSATANTSDEIYGGIRSFTRDVSRGIESLVHGDNMLSPISYEQATESSRQANEAAEKANPKSYLAGEITGIAGTGAAGATTKTGQAVIRSGSRGLLPNAKGFTGKLANLATKSAVSGAAGATTNAAYEAGAAREGERLEAAREAVVPGGIFGAAAPIAAAGAVAGGKAVKEAVLPTIEETTKTLATRAREFGIPLRIDQISPTRARKTVQKVSQEIPLSGADAFEDTQRKAFTKAVAKTIGQESDDLGPETIKNFRQQVGNKFDTVLSGKQVKVAADDLARIEAIKQEAANTIETNLADVVARNVDDVLEDMAKGTLTGEKLASIRSELLRRSTRAQGGASESIGDIVEAIDDIATRNITPEEAKTLAEARRQWRNFRTIQPLLEKSTDGTINPTQLINRVSSSRFIDASSKAVGDDDLVDLARIGKEFLPKAGGSDTFQKSLIGGGAGAGLITAVTNPLLAVQGAAITGGALALNRGFQAANRSQRLVDLVLSQGNKGVKQTPRLQSRAPGVRKAEATPMTSAVDDAADVSGGPKISRRDFLRGAAHVAAHLTISDLIK